jgi:Phage major capsid protein E/Rho termination factor, N-terminal domain
MNTDPNYEPRTLLEPFLEGPLVHTFLRDTFFAGREYPPTSMIEFDFRRGRRKMAPFVAPLIGGKVMERQGYETRFFRAPRIAPARALRTPDLEPRLPGETIYSGRTAADRAAELLAEDSVFLDEAISRREEWMCRQVLVNGSITVTAENGYTNLISFLEYGIPAQQASNHETVAITWDQATSDPLMDLERARLNTIKASGISPNIALFGNTAKETFIRNANVAKYLDNRRFELGSIAPIIESDSVVRFGMVPGLELYHYSEYFEDDAGTLFPMLPDPLVMILSTNVQNKIVYGAFTQLEDVRAKRFQTYQTSRIPLIYGDEEDGQLFYRLTSCPLPMPTDILGFRIIEALPGGQGPFARGGTDGSPVEPQPYFESEKIEKQPQLTEEGIAARDAALGPERPDNGKPNGYEGKTVAELKDIAADRGIEVPSDARKADIIAELREDDKRG